VNRSVGARSAKLEILRLAGMLRVKRTGLAAVGAYLFHRGIYAALDVAASIRLRICAAHTWDQIEQLVSTLADVSDRFRPRGEALV